MAAVLLRRRRGGGGGGGALSLTMALDWLAAYGPAAAPRKDAWKNDRGQTGSAIAEVDGLSGSQLTSGGDRWRRPLQSACMPPSTVPDKPTASSITQYHKPSGFQRHSTIGDMCLGMPSSLRRAFTSRALSLVMGSSSPHEVACRRPPGRSEAGTNPRHHSPDTETGAHPSGRPGEWCRLNRSLSRDHPVRVAIAKTLQGNRSYAPVKIFRRKPLNFRHCSRACPANASAYNLSMTPRSTFGWDIAVSGGGEVFLATSS
ncbi:hypothetical protein LZ30DRAFT_691579 [Colletotrichum cereale]|nr:hypothetical protein LZ30DRAFT_691579 [Colletotrichum cereale]